MIVKIEVGLQPFTIPYYVRRSKENLIPGDESEPAFPLACVDAQTLSMLCDEFREAVFAKAGKTDPRLK